MTRVLVLYYSSHGHTAELAAAIQAGAKNAGADTALMRVPELVPESVAKAAGYKSDPDAPIATVNDLTGFDAIIFGSPTRFGNMSAQMRNFLDQTGALWVKGSLIGKVASVFTSTSSQHGGQETTILSFYPTLIHHGMIIVGIPYSAPELVEMKEIMGGSPYGAATIIRGPDKGSVTAKELALAHFQGVHVTRIASKLSSK